VADETDIITEPESSADAVTPTEPAAAQPAATLDSIVPNEVAAEEPSAELKAIIEALIFASPDPLTLKAIYKLLDNEPKEEVQTAIVELKQDYERPGGLQIVEVAGAIRS